MWELRCNVDDIRLPSERRTVVIWCASDEPECNVSSSGILF